MREYERDLSKIIAQGLRQRRRPQEDSLIQCYNAVPTETGIHAYVRPDIALPCSTADWPYPMTWVGGKEKFLALRDAIYKIESNWDLTKIVDVSHPRDFADFGDYVVFACGSQVIVKDTEAETFAAILADASFPEFQTCCSFRGQLIVGNVTSSWSGAGYDSVGWSNIGRADFTIGSGNEAGHMRVPWAGEVKKVKALGAAVMVYGANGVGRIFPHEQTYGFEQLLNIGVLGDFAVSGDESEHMFVDAAYNLWKVLDGKPPEKIDCQEWFDGMVYYDTVGLFDSNKRHFYFSDGVKTLVFGEGRLFEVGILPTSLMYVDYYFTGTWVEAEDNSNCAFNTDDLVLGIDTINSRRRSLKTLTFLEADADYEGSLYLSGGYRYDSGDYSPTQWLNATQEGAARIQLTASDVRVRLKLTEYSETDRVVFLTSRWQFPDNRYIRSLSHDNPVTS
ncbi:hypothetical protein KAR91_15760 [Candidatus Pacearchaeota archaeon]|nr:hypothetical protein [Candidatus Pacearchaeota archaeon]